MSRTSPVPVGTKITEKYVSFNGEMGKLGLKVGDQDLVDLPFPFTFIVLSKEAYGVTGAVSQAVGAERYKSNMAHRKYTTNLRVVIGDDKANIVAEGQWSSIKDKPALAGKAKYTQYIFGLADFGNGKEIFRLALHGQAQAQWVNFSKENDVYSKIAVQISGVQEVEGVKFKKKSLAPVFKAVAVSDETIALADKMTSEVLDPWFDAYFDAATPQAASQVASTPQPAPQPTSQTAQEDVYVARPQQSVPPATPPVQAPAPKDDDSDLPF